MISRLPLVHTESELARRVRIQLHRRVELRDVEVHEDHGTIRLHGRVASFFLRQLCISGSQRVAGVHQVIDQIEVARPEVHRVA